MQFLAQHTKTKQIGGNSKPKRLVFLNKNGPTMILNRNSDDVKK